MAQPGQIVHNETEKLVSCHDGYEQVTTVCVRFNSTEQLLMNPAHTQIKEKMRILECLLGKLQTVPHAEAPSKVIVLYTGDVIFSHALAANFFCAPCLG